MHSPRPLLVVFVAFFLAVASCGDGATDSQGASEVPQATTTSAVAEEAGDADGQDAPESELEDDTTRTQLDEATEGDAQPEDDTSDPELESSVPFDDMVGSGPADFSLEPVRIGLINQENDPVASFPDLRVGVEAGVEWVNTDLGGIDGHPLEVVVCLQASPEDALACAQDLATQDLVAVINGLNIWTLAFDLYGTLGDTPVLGGIPLFEADFTAPTARYFNGGSLAVFAAMTRFAVEDLGAEKILVLKGFNPATDVAIELAIAPMVEFYGVELTSVTIPPGSPDPSSSMAEVAAAGADAVMVLASDAECANVIPFVDTFGIDRSSMIYTTACSGEQTHSLVGESMIGSWVQRGGPTVRDAWLGDEVLDGLADSTATIEAYAGDTPYSDFIALGVGTVLDVQRLLVSTGYENLNDADAIFATADDGTKRGAINGGFGWACTYADLGFPAICSGDHRFVEIIDAVGNSAPPIGDDPVDGLKALREAAAG